MAVWRGKEDDWATPLGNDGQERSEGQRGQKVKKKVISFKVKLL